MRSSAIAGWIAGLLAATTAATMASCRGDDGSRAHVAAPAGPVTAVTKVSPAGVDGRYAWTPSADGAFTAKHPQQHMQMTVTERGADVGWPGESWHFAFAAERVGCDEAREELGPGIARRVADNRIEFERTFGEARLRESFESGLRGLEHILTLPSDPCPGRNLIVEVAMRGLDPVARAGIRGVELRDPRGMARMRYTDLSARDATGARLAASMTAEVGRVALHVSTAGAHFPVVIDPLAWVQVAELTASDGAPDDNFGQAVAISGDTAVIGAPGKSAAYIFARSGGVWAQQQELTGDFEGGFGTTVAIDGDTALISELLGVGATYVYVRSGSTWTQTQEIDQQGYTLEDGGIDYLDGIGASLSLSGSTAFLGMPYTLLSPTSINYAQGAAAVYVQSGGTWNLAQLLQAPDAPTSDEFGCSVAFSGTTAIVGSCFSPNVYLFSQSGSIWALQQEVTVPYLPAYNQVVALSGSKAMALGGDGRLYSFAQSNGAWTEQPAPQLGGAIATSVALSNGMAVVGVPANVADDDGGADSGGGDASVDAGPGEVLVFSESDAGWSLAQTLTANDGVRADEFGSAVAVSGTTLVIGAPYRTVNGNSDQGAVYVEDFGPGPGTGCSVPADCVSGYCVDGVCCDSPCSSVCVACAASLQESAPDGGAPRDGTCGPAKAGTNPHSDACGPDPTSSCGRDGECDGTGACQFYLPTTPCGSCTGSSLTTSNCNGSGACVVGTATSCPNNLVCAEDASVCKTTCSTDGDCTGGTVCTNGSCTVKSGGPTCVGQSSSRSEDGGVQDCGAYACGPAGTCNQTCASVHDCANGYACDPANQCVPTPGNPGTSSSCSAWPGPAEGTWGAVVAALAMIGAARRRRRSG